MTTLRHYDTLLSRHVDSSRRPFMVLKTSTDAFTSSAVAEYPVIDGLSAAITISEIGLRAVAGITSGGSVNTAVFTFTAYDEDNAQITTIVGNTGGLAPYGLGSIAANTRVTLYMPASVELPAGGCLTFKITKTGSGLAVPPCGFSIVWAPA